MVGTVALAVPADAATTTMAMQFRKSSNLTITASELVDGVPVRTSGYLGSNTQRWVLPTNTTVASEYRLARLIRSGNSMVPGCLDLPPNQQSTVGAQLVIRRCNGSAGQKWTRTNFVDDGATLTAVLRNSQNGLVVQEQFGFASAVVQAKFTGAANQRTEMVDLKSS